MRVLVDAHMLGHRETGNETYVRGLLAGLASIPGVAVAAAIEPDHRETDAGGITWLRLPTGSSWRRLTRDLAQLADRWSADVVHATYLAPLRSRCPVVVSVHDVSFKRFPEHFSLRDRALFALLLPASLRRAAAVLALSAHGREELQRFYPGLRAPVHVVPAAASDVFRPLDAAAVDPVLSRHGVRRPYLLAVGSVQPRKNLVRLIEAFEPLAAVHPALQLVIVGPGGFRASAVHETVAARGLTDRVPLLGYVPDTDLVALYNAAIALVYPSVYEGFGLPVVEAMACGRPVIAAGTSSLPEVVGDAGLLVDPFDTGALHAAMARIVSDAGLAGELASRGLARAAEFSWTRTAASALRAYEAACAARAA